MFWDIAIVGVFAAIAVWLLALPLKWSPFRSVRENARRDQERRRNG